MTALSYWNTNVNELLSLMRDSLSVLAPVVEKAHIPWREKDAYDDWDAITAAIYENIVVRSILHAVDIRKDLSMPKYGFVYPSYCAYDVISVETLQESVKGGIAAFIGFSGQTSPVEYVKWLAISLSGEVLDKQIQFSKYDECKFLLRQRVQQGRSCVCSLEIVI